MWSYATCSILEQLKLRHRKIQRSVQMDVYDKHEMEVEEMFELVLEK